MDSFAKGLKVLSESEFPLEAMGCTIEGIDGFRVSVNGKKVHIYSVKAIIESLAKGAKDSGKKEKKKEIDNED